jgi:ketosteroid isomerase-like protein
MSRENIEAVRKVTNAMARDDLDEVLRRCDPDVTYRPAQEAATYGQQDVRRALERWGGDIERLELVTEELLDAGDRVVLTILLRGRGRISGAEIATRFYEVFKLRDGAILRWEEFTDRGPALEAAGLSE